MWSYLASIAFTKSMIEKAALHWLESLGWTANHGPKIAPDELAAAVKVCPTRSRTEGIWRKGYSGTAANGGTMHDL
jgi:hypothetical protein